jgi:hypothetical protein
VCLFSLITSETSECGMNAMSIFSNFHCLTISNANVTTVCFCEVDSDTSAGSSIGPSNLCDNELSKDVKFLCRYVSL